MDNEIPPSAWHEPDFAFYQALQLTTKTNHKEPNPNVILYQHPTGENAASNATGAFEMGAVILHLSLRTPEFSLCAMKPKISEYEGDRYINLEMDDCSTSRV